MLNTGFCVAPSLRNFYFCKHYFVSLRATTTSACSMLWCVQQHNSSIHADNLKWMPTNIMRMQNHNVILCSPNILNEFHFEKFNEAMKHRTSASVELWVCVCRHLVFRAACAFVAQYFSFFQKEKNNFFRFKTKWSYDNNIKNYEYNTRSHTHTKKESRPIRNKNWLPTAHSHKICRPSVCFIYIYIYSCCCNYCRFYHRFYSRWFVDVLAR